jgi:hypothetical protein
MACLIFQKVFEEDTIDLNIVLKDKICNQNPTGETKFGLEGVMRR